MNTALKPMYVGSGDGPFCHTSSVSNGTVPSILVHFKRNLMEYIEVKKDLIRGL